MRSSFALNALVVFSGLTTALAKDLATVTPCPDCPKSIKQALITVTEQYQPVSTCSPVKTCHKKHCYQTAKCETYDFVSTEVPCNGGTSTTLITKTDQLLTLAHVSEVQTSYAPCATATTAPYWNGTAPLYQNATACTSTSYQTVVVDLVAPYNDCGPLALPPWEGSGLCKKCGDKPEIQKDQPVHVSKCIDGACSTYQETWVSVKPTPASSSAAVKYSSSAYCSKAGVNTISVTATFTPSAAEGGDSGYTAPVTKTFAITTSVAKPQNVVITKTITVTYTKKPEPTVSHSSSVAAVSTKTFCHSNGVYTIPIVTTCKPSGPHFTEPVTTTVFYTTTVTDGPKTIECTKTVTVIFTSTTTICPQTVISGHTQSTSATAPPSVSATTTGSSPSSTDVASNSGSSTGASGSGASNTGASNTGASNTGASGTGASPTGASGTGASNTGASGTGASGTGASGTGASGTGASPTGASGTGASGTGASPTGASGTGASGTGASPTGASGTGASSTGAYPTGASTTGSSGPVASGADFEYYGCLGSTDGFPTFSLEDSNPSNNVESCTSDCKTSGFAFAGLYTTDCYCAGSIDAGTDAKSQGLCNIPCPGNAAETCGGNTSASKRSIAAGILLDVYEISNPTPTSSSASSTSEPTSDPSSDADAAPVARSLDADMEVAAPRARDLRLRRGGLLRNPSLDAKPALAKRDLGIKKPFGA